jgi:hypothetical protein
LEDDNGKKTLTAKRGDLSGVKYVFRDDSSLTDVVTLDSKPPSKDYRALLQPLIRNGEIVRDFIPADELRERTVKDVKLFSSGAPRMIVK